MRDINIYALDNQLNMIAILKPTNIQWSRKYYENGYFSILFHSFYDEIEILLEVNTASS